ncbi:MAG TPA: hypothetical protein PK861_10165, partial [Thermomonas sp.]|nr:hypothetical protein [Thermomonas sp.]
MRKQTRIWRVLAVACLLSGMPVLAASTDPVLQVNTFIGTQEDIHLVLDHLITEALRSWIQRLARSATRPLKALILAATTDRVAVLFAV